MASEWDITFDRNNLDDPNPELKRVMGRYHLEYDRPGDVRGSRTFQHERNARRFLEYIGGSSEDTPTKKNTGSGDPLQTGSQDALDDLAAQAREDASGPKPGERTASGDIQTNAGFSVEPVDTREPEGEKTDMKSNTTSEQARRLLSGAGGGGPTGDATVGVDPSAGHIPGTPESVLPSNMGAGSSGGGTPRNEASDPTRQNPNATADGQASGPDIMGVGTVVAVVGLALWALSQVFD